MTAEERAQLIEDIKTSATKRERIVEQATLNKKFDLAAAWEGLEDLDTSITNRIAASRLKQK